MRDDKIFDDETESVTFDPEEDALEGDDYEPDFNSDMDGDAESALASAGFGTDEDYGCFNDGEDF